MSVYKKLNEAREKFHALKLTKTGHNKFAGYKYFELGDFLIPALGVFREVGLCAVVTFDGQTARMVIVDTDKPDAERIIIESPMGSAALKGCHEVQNIGAVETYQRRYLWVAALEIVEHDAIDATTGTTDRIPASVKHTPTDGPVDVPADRQTLIQLAASVAAEMFKAGEKDAAFDKIEEFLSDGEEMLFLQTTLKAHAAFRAYIKFRQDQARKRAAQPQPATEEEFT